MSKSCQKLPKVVENFKIFVKIVKKKGQKVVKKLSKSSLKKAKIVNFEVEDETCGRRRRRRRIKEKTKKINGKY
jgi:hypothetical protein